MKPLNLFLFAVLCCILVAIPLAFSYSNGVVDPFLHGIVSSAILYKDADHVQVDATQFSNVPGLGFLVILLSRLLGLDPETIEYLPIAGAGLAVACFLTSRRLSGSVFIGAAVTLAIMYRWLPPTLTTIWPHTFGFGLHLLFVTTYLKLQPKTQVKGLLVLWLLFVGMHLFSYTAEVWTIAFVAAITLLRFLRGNRDRPLTSSLLLALVATFLGFTEIVYSAYLPRLDTAQSEFQLGLGYLFSSIFRSPPPTPYAWVPPSQSPVVLALQISWYLLLFIPIFAILAFMAFRSRQGGIRKVSWPSFGAVFAGFIAAWTVDAASYALLGAVSIGIFRYSSLGGALLAPPSLSHIGKYRFRFRSPASGLHAIAGFCSVLTVLSVLLFISAAQQSIFVTSTSKYQTAKPAGEWILFYSPTVNHILGDHITQGEFALEAARLGSRFQSNDLYNATTFAALIGATDYSVAESVFHDQFVAVNRDLAGYKTTAGGWFDFEPLQAHLREIEENQELNLIYDDGSIWVLAGR